MNLIDEMANEAMSDDYFIKLFGLAEKMYWQHIIENPSWVALTLTPSQFDDLLTFADILSLSSNPSHRNTALKVISCLQPSFSNNPKYQYFSKGIMVRLGNFPGYKLLSGSNSDSDETSLDIAIEKEFKLSINKDQKN